MVRHGLKHIFQKPTPDIDSSDRTQQLRSKTIYSGTVNLAQHLVKGNNSLYKTYTGPYEVVTQAGNSNLIASRSYDDLLSITKGKVLLNQLPLTPLTRDYYEKNFAKGQMYEGNYNQFDPELNISKKCENAVLVYDIGTTGFAGPASYDTNGGFIGATGPTGSTGGSDNNKRIFIDPNHCYYSDPCLLDASYTRFVSPGLTGTPGPTGTAGPALFNAQQIISSNQYRGFSYPMSNFNLTCEQQLPNQAVGPLFCPPVYQLNVLDTTFPRNTYTIQYLTSGGLETSSPQVDGFTVYQFGTSGTVPLDTQVTQNVTYRGGGSLDIHYAVVGGGGGGGSSFFYGEDQPDFPCSSGGGGGGFFSSTFPSLSPVQLLSGVSYPVTVGGGGSAGSIAGPHGQPGQNGQNSVINFHLGSGSSTGYGGGGGATAFTTNGGNIGKGSNGNNDKGNGGGGAGSPDGGETGGTGTFNGGNGSTTSYAGGGGGGGMNQVGGLSNGGNGIPNTIAGVTQYFGAGGGGGVAYLSTTDDSYGLGGLGGGGNGGGWNTNYNLVQAQNGANVYGSGGGGAYSVLPPVSPFTRSSVSGANGGSGSVWIRFNSYAILN
jgi:hypothetical protein